MKYLLAITFAALLTAAPAYAISGSALQLNSGTVAGSAAQLNNNGYAGTYITLAEKGDVTVTVNATGTSFGGVDPHMNIVIADTRSGFDVMSGGGTSYSHNFQALPAGTYFVRTELNNDGGTGRALTINSLEVEGATIDTSTSDTVLRANALAAADTYIANFRKGTGKVALVGVAPGTQVGVKLKSHAFNFGTNVPGNSASDINNYLGTPTPGSQPANFQEFINSHFNMLVPSNYGKWSNTEGMQDVPTMDRVNTLLTYAANHDMRARMHALMWGDQNPNWVLNTAPEPDTGVLAQALDGNPTPYRQEISERIDYYVADGPGGLQDQALRYVELDVHNEHRHRIGPWTVFGATGLAEIFNETKDAALSVGADVKLYLNEFNVLQNSPNSIVPDTTVPIDRYTGVATGSDPYANWYRQDIDAVRDAGGAVSGVGAQYYAVPQAGGVPSTHTIMRAMQNLAVTGLPFSLTEFGVQEAAGGPAVNEGLAADIVEQALRMVFGNPNAETFMYWGFWDGATSDLQRASALVYNTWKNPDGTWNLTPAGKRFEWLFGKGVDATKGGVNASPWNTDLTAVVGDDGTIDFTGFYGDYELTIGNETYDLALNKGDALYSLAIAPGDYNADGSVDAADYVVWRNTLGTNDLRADGNGDKSIDELDFAVWKSTFGMVYGSGAGAFHTVPEPSSITLLAVGTTLCIVRRRRRPLPSVAAL
jgi:GH35 family endo-1,4-beta-xylanase